MHPADLPHLPVRDAAGHKGTFGSVCVVGGCAQAATRMIGAPVLTATAALRSGAGLCKVATPLPIIDSVISLIPSATGIALAADDDGHLIPHEAAASIDELVNACDCLAIGPGLGKGEGPRAVALRAVQQEDVPVVVDADAINALAEVPQLTRDLRGSVVLTPHPGEFKRLVRGMGMNGDLGLAESRETAAEKLAQRLACIVVLKGAGTVVTDGVRTWTNPSGHPCLATGGTGDVLTGVIAAIVAQFVSPPAPHMPGISPEMAAKLGGAMKKQGKPLTLYDAVRLGVYAHGLAAERWAASHRATGGMLAQELTEQLPATLETLRATTI